MGHFQGKRNLQKLNLSVSSQQWLLCCESRFVWNLKDWGEVIFISFLFFLLVGESPGASASVDSGSFMGLAWDCSDFISAPVYFPFREWMLQKFFGYLVTTTPCITFAAAAAAKSLQSCRTLCHPIDGSPPGSPVPGILQARTLEWVAISFSNGFYLGSVFPLVSRWGPWSQTIRAGKDFLGCLVQWCSIFFFFFFLSRELRALSVHFPTILALRWPLRHIHENIGLPENLGYY